MSDTSYGEAIWVISFMIGAGVGLILGHFHGIAVGVGTTLLVTPIVGFALAMSVSGAK